MDIYLHTSDSVPFDSDTPLLPRSKSRSQVDDNDHGVELADIGSSIATTGECCIVAIELPMSVIAKCMRKMTFSSNDHNYNACRTLITILSIAFTPDCVGDSVELQSNTVMDTLSTIYP